MPELGIGLGRPDPRPSWVTVGARFDLDFEHGRYWDGRVRSRVEDVTAWAGGAPVLDAEGLICDGSQAWVFDDLPGLSDARTAYAVRVELTEELGASDPGYLAILHAGSLADRLALLTTRTGLASRMTVSGQEVFTRTIAQPANSRYHAMLGVRPDIAYLERHSHLPVTDNAVAMPSWSALTVLEIGGFNATLPLKGVVHRLTVWAGLAVPSTNPDGP